MSWHRRPGGDLVRSFPPIWVMHVYRLPGKNAWGWAVWRGEIGLRGKREKGGGPYDTQREAREECEAAVVELVRRACP